MYDYDKPVESLIITEVTYHSYHYLVHGHVGLKIRIKPGEGVCVIGPRFIIEKRDHQEHNYETEKCEREEYAVENVDAAPALETSIDVMVSCG